MAKSCLAIVAGKEDFRQEVERYLEKKLGFPALTCDFESIGNYLNQDSDGLIFVGVLEDTDLTHLIRLIQDISLQQLPNAVVVLEGKPGKIYTPKSLLPYLSASLQWPAQAEELAVIAKSYWHCASPFSEEPELPLKELLELQLQTNTPSLAPLADRIALAAQHDVTVLLTGETGTGKTYFARLIHNHSPRKDQKFLPIACGAISTNLVESEFFGHTRGAFTGADRNKVGKFEAVGEGTLLLDEIDTLGMEQQAALLRVIETGEFEPVGSVETHLCRARIIVASNIMLEKAVEENTFRPDLYYRLNVMSFHLPPLRERLQDIAPLAQRMASRFNRKFNKELFEISSQAMAALESYPWPGNIRQLENTIQHAVLVSDGPELLLRHLPESVQEHTLDKPWKNETPSNSLHQQRDVSERNAIHRALVMNGYSRSRAASTLGISRVTLYKKMKKYGLMNIPLNPPTEVL